MSELNAASIHNVVQQVCALHLEQDRPGARNNEHLGQATQTRSKRPSLSPKNEHQMKQSSHDDSEALQEAVDALKDLAIYYHCRQERNENIKSTTNKNTPDICTGPNDEPQSLNGESYAYHQHRYQVAIDYLREIVRQDQRSLSSETTMMQEKSPVVSISIQPSHENDNDNDNAINKQAAWQQCQRQKRDSLTRICVDVCGPWACFCAALDFLKYHHRRKDFVPNADGGSGHGNSLARDRHSESSSTCITGDENGMTSELALAICLQLFKTILCVGQQPSSPEMHKMKKTPVASDNDVTGAPSESASSKRCSRNHQQDHYLQQLVTDWAQQHPRPSITSLNSTVVTNTDTSRMNAIRHADHDDNKMEELAQIMILIPMQISSALCAASFDKKKQLQLPLWCTRTRYPKALLTALMIETVSMPSSTKGGKDEKERASFAILLQQLIQHVTCKMVGHGGAIDVVQAWYGVWSSITSSSNSKNANDDNGINIRADVEQQHQQLRKYSRLIEQLMIVNQSNNRESGADELKFYNEEGNIILSASTTKSMPQHVLLLSQRQLGMLLYLTLQQAAAADYSTADTHQFIGKNRNTEFSPPTSSAALAFLRDTIPQPLLTSSSSPGARALQQELIKRTLFSNNGNDSNSLSTASSSSKQVPHLLAKLFSSSSSSSSLLKHQLALVSTMWSENLYINRTPPHHQRPATEFLLCGLQLLLQEQQHQQLDKKASRQKQPSLSSQQQEDTHRFDPPADYEEEVIMPLVAGVSARLESCVQGVRMDGMRVAQTMAPLLGQEVEFDELREQEAEEERKEEETQKMQNSLNDGPLPLSSSTIKHEHDSQEDDASSTSSSDWDEDDLIPYDLEDDEEDLKGAAQRPIYLRECLAMLRTLEDDEDVSRKQEEALKGVALLIRSCPPDLVDLCVPLAKELLHLENRYNIPNFVEMSSDGLTALLVMETMAVSEFLIGILFTTNSVSTGTRIDILDILSMAAHELSGAKVLEEIKDQRKQVDGSKNKDPRQLLTSVTEKISGKRALVPPPLSTSTSIGTGNERTLSVKKSELGLTRNNNVDDEPKTRRWGQRRNAPLPSVKNEFGPIAAPMFFYPLVKAFVDSKSESSIWSRGDGARLMSKFILTLTAFVQCSGAYPGTTHILARDVASLVWEFHTAESPTVRQAVLVAVATCLMVLLPSHNDVLQHIVMKLSGLPAFLTQTAVNEQEGSNRDLSSTSSSRDLALYVLQTVQQTIQESMAVMPTPSKK
jgi:hypothetical protein